MTHRAIHVSELSKKYLIGATSQRSNDSLRDWITSRVRRGRHDAREEELWALREVSFEVARGEVVGVIGRNGAGKSTLLKILSRITEPTSGKVTLNGRVGSLLEVGTGFHPELTGRENVYLSGAILGMRRQEIERNYEEIVAFAGIEQFMETPIKRYSSGMNVRLGFAVAAHLNPEILLVDEVLAVGDASFQRKCLGKMSDVAEAGRTVLFVSHNLPAVQSLCSRTIAVSDGRILIDSDSESAIRHYLDTLADRDSEQRPSLSGSEKGVAWMTDVALVDAQGRGLAEVETGQAVVIRLKFETAAQVRSPSFGVIIATRGGHQVAQMTTAITLGEIAAAKRGGQVSLHIPELNLMPGRYHLKVGISRAGEQLFLHENALQFSVRAVGLYDTGRLPPAGSVTTYMPCHWSFDYA